MEEMFGKVKTAIEFLKDGQSFTVADLRLSIEENNTLRVTGWSQYIDFENLTTQQSIKELEEIKSLFKRMIEVSSDLRTFIEGKSIKYSLYFDDYGRASIPICSEENGLLKWEVNIKS
jgi:hypothetical protein